MSPETIDLISFVVISMLNTSWIYAGLYSLVIGYDVATKHGIVVLLLIAMCVGIFFTYIGWGEVTPVDQPPRCWGPGVCD